MLAVVAVVGGLAACTDPQVEPGGFTPVPMPGEDAVIGDVEVHGCQDLDGVWCGSIEVPRDRDDPDGDTISVGFEWFPRTYPSPPDGLLVAMEGGPGYATTASRDYYTELFEPLLDHRDLLLMDLRGTGRSEPVNCPDLQAYRGDYVEDTGACGRLLGERADDWGTVAGADDLADLLEALDAPDDVALYGDSYGSWFAQVFALRHGDRLSSLILDGTCVVLDMDPWYPTAAEVLRDQLDDEGTLTRLARALRREPLVADGTTIGSRELGDLAASGAFNRLVARDLDAAGRAWLDDHDPAPLVRLFTENADEGTVYPLSESSEGEYASVTCNDYDQLYDMASPPAERRRQFRRSVDEYADEHPDAFAPFTVREWVTSASSAYRDCIEWPVIPGDGPVLPPDSEYPDVPTLILSGELDSITPIGEARIVAEAMPEATLVEIPSSTHVTALGDPYDCASALVVRFVAEKDAGDTSCTDDIPELPRASAFPTTTADAAPADDLGDAPAADRRVVTVAVATVSDALARLRELYVNHGMGLRGGRYRFRASDDGELTMEGVRLTTDARVSGTVGAELGEGADVDVTVELDDGRTAELSWTLGELGDTVVVDGTVGGRPVRAEARYD
jgi:pimeloyl-ACP methyl ester carboxylesterase